MLPVFLYTRPGESIPTLRSGTVTSLDARRLPPATHRPEGVPGGLFAFFAKCYKVQFKMFELINKCLSLKFAGSSLIGCIVGDVRSINFQANLRVFSFSLIK